MTLTINWQNPPDQRRNNPIADELDQAANALLDRPGHWALLYPDLKTSTAKARATALRTRDPRIRCRVATHDTTDKATADLYAQLPAPATTAIRVAS